MNRRRQPRDFGQGNTKHSNYPLIGADSRSSSSEGFLYYYHTYNRQKNKDIDSPAKQLRYIPEGINGDGKDDTPS